VSTAPDRFLNRELSWLEFDRRVLALAEDPHRPLLERIRFVAIFSRNLDEFFQVRVASLQDQEAAGVGPSPDGLSPTAQLAVIRERVIELCARAHDLLAKEILPALAEVGITLRSWQDLSPEQQLTLGRRFEAELDPVLVPQSTDPTHPFPYVSDLSLNVAALVRPRRHGPTRFARIKVPSFADRLWPAGDGLLVPVEEVIRAHLGELFPNDEILHTGTFRVTRDAELALRESESVDLVRDIEAGLRRRLRGSDAVRLEVSADLAPEITQLLTRHLRLEAEEVYRSPGLLDVGDLMELVRLDRPQLLDPPWTPRPVAALRAAETPGAVFAALRESDFLVHHPYDAFEASVERFLEAAADDPHVRVVMSTIYRTGGPESGIVRALERAALAGKQVVVLVELKARFEEASNLERARSLERSGAHVAYGIVGLKTHAKVALAVRAEAGGLRRYCHVGTGNYNPVTARIYEDLGLLTARAEVASDVAELLQHLISGSGGRRYRRLLVAPESLRSGILSRIRREADAPDGRIVAKLNNISDPEVIDALYAASQAGTRIDLVVRGICCLRPGVPGLSENIRVRSVLGRFLEHSRILRFGSPERGLEHWIGSADLMPRNLDLRVEALVPIEDAELRERLDRLLALLLAPSTRAWELMADGRWQPGDGSVDAQEELQAEALARSAATP
jgi:polyphosphate kinase